jgi:hypothetical protein
MTVVVLHQLSTSPAQEQRGWALNRRFEEVLRGGHLTCVPSPFGAKPGAKQREALQRTFNL